MVPFSEEFRQEIDTHTDRSKAAWVHQSVSERSNSDN